MHHAKIHPTQIGIPAPIGGSRKGASEVLAKWDQ